MTRAIAPTCHHYCNTLHCPECTKRFWKWAASHTNGTPRQRKGEQPERTFYECAADHLALK